MTPEIRGELPGTDPAPSSARSRAPVPPLRDRPVEFWPTAEIRAALETDDIGVWQHIVAAIKRDPFGRTARQVEEVLDTARPYGVSRAISEVLVHTREHLESNECGEVARHVHLLLDRSGLGEHEFASRIGVQPEDLARYLHGSVSPPASLMIRMGRLSERFAKMRNHNPPTG